MKCDTYMWLSISMHGCENLNANAHAQSYIYVYVRKGWSLPGTLFSGREAPPACAKRDRCLHTSDPSVGQAPRDAPWRGRACPGTKWPSRRSCMAGPLGAHGPLFAGRSIGRDRFWRRLHPRHDSDPYYFGERII